MFSWSALLAIHSHLPSALQGYKPGLAANPLLHFPFYFPPQPRELMDFPLLFFSGGEITKWCPVHYQPAGFHSIQKE